MSDDSATLSLLKHEGGTDAKAHLMPTLLAITLPHTNKEPILLQVNSLLDTGAITHNYMSHSLAGRLQALGVAPHSRCAHVVSSALSENDDTTAMAERGTCVKDECSACNNECLECSNSSTAASSAVVNTTHDACDNYQIVGTTNKRRGVVVSQCYDLKLMLLTEFTRRRDLQLTFSVIKSPFDLIIGRQAIIQHDLTKTCREYFVQTLPSTPKKNTVLKRPVVATVISDTKTQPTDVNDVATVKNTTVEGLTNVTDELTPSVRPLLDLGIGKGGRQRSHPIHTAVHGYENEVILERRNKLLDVELAMLRDRHLVTAACRVGKWATRSLPDPLIENPLGVTPAGRGSMDSRLKATSLPTGTSLCSLTTSIDEPDCYTDDKEQESYKLSDFVGEAGPDAFDDMLSAVDNSLHYPTENPSSLEGSLPAVANTVFEGDEAASAQLRSLIYEYQDIFSKGYKTEPARVAPMELRVDPALWATRANSQKVRPQSIERENELRKQLTKLEAAHIISRSSEVQHWSQVLLVRKPHDDVTTGEKLWRFCVDYVNLNRASQPERWPLPKIDDLLEQIGQHRPKVFAKIDLTHGFHQAGLAASARHWTAFIVSFGLFVWNRVPMGLKGAPGYFQGQMQMVLGALLMICCALYIDDILIWGNSNAELIANLRLVFERLRQYNITVHPDKVFIGMKQLEFVGHTIDEKGIHFTREKIDKVFQIPIPVYDSEMKSFLGLAQYFSDHVKDFARIAAPLHELIKQYDKRKKKRLDYTQEAIDAFEEIKTAINECPKLYFYDPNLPVYLTTDASDIACGAYLYQQLPDGKQIPIRFCSKKFSATEKRWDTPHKEAYALFYGVMQFEYLLRDAKFTIRTDHKNLVFLATSTNKKVVRWKIALQAFDADIEFIEGKKNVVADALSRLVPADPVDYHVAELASLVTDPEVAPSTTELPTGIGTTPLTQWAFNSTNQRWERKSVETAMEQPSAPANTNTLPNRVRKRQAVSALKHRTRATGSFVLNHELQRRLSPHERRAMKDLRPVHLPAEARDMLMRVHNDVVGHHSVERMLQKLAELGFSWPYMRAHAHLLVEQCPMCQKMSYLKAPIVARHFTTATYEPMQRLNIDHVGPYEEDEDGNKYILVIIDCFTRWLELYPVKSVDAETTANALLQHFGRFGCPTQIVSDRGPAFVNQLIHEFIRVLDFEWALTLQYSKEENAIVERANREVLRHLRAIINHRKMRGRWSKATPFVQRIFNSTVKESLGLAPGRILFGNNIRLDTNIFHFPELKNGAQSEQPLSQWVSDKLNLQQLAVEIAQSTQLKREQKRFEDEGPRITTTFPTGSFVLVEDPPTTNKPKLLPEHKGPFEVMGHSGDTYEVRNLVHNGIMPVHIGRLRPFHYDASVTNPYHIAMQDDQEFIVERILEHRGSPNDKTAMRFLVKWKDFPEDANSWEPWYDSRTGAGVRDNAVLHDYLRKLGLERLIPATQRNAYKRKLS